jgi:hypothetical protein
VRAASHLLPRDRQALVRFRVRPQLPAPGIDGRLHAIDISLET